MKNGEDYGQPPEEGEQEDFYQDLRRKVDRWIKDRKGPGWIDDLLLFVPDVFYLLMKLFSDRRISAQSKLILGSCIAYFIWPMDIIPDIIGPLGFIDDLALSCFALNEILNEEDPAIAHEVWPGEGSILDVTKKVVKRGDEWIGSGLVDRIRALLAKWLDSPEQR